MGFQQVILTEPIDNLGSEADVVKVRRGFARNFLIPRGKALEVTAGSLRRVNSLKARRAEREARELTEAEELSRRLGRMTLQFVLETGERGRAFGSITSKDLLERLATELGENVTLPRHAVSLDQPIKTTGEHSIAVKVHSQVTASLRVMVNPPVADEAAEEAEGAKKSRGRKGERE